MCGNTETQLQTHVLLLTSLPVCKAAKAAALPRKRLLRRDLSAFNKLADQVGGETVQPTHVHHKTLTRCATCTINHSHPLWSAPILGMNLVRPERSNRQSE